jgi:hypothetical protein
VVKHFVEYSQTRRYEWIKTNNHYLYQLRPGLRDESGMGVVRSCSLVTNKGRLFNKITLIKNFILITGEEKMGEVL